MTQDTQKKRTPREREYAVELEEPARHRLAYTLGTAAGLGLALLLKRALDGPGGREGDAAPPRRFGPARLRRTPRVRDALLQVEDAVLAAFMDDETLSGRGIDVGAISPGIVELSGSVRSRPEAAHAVAVARGVEGVATVVNRMDVDEERERLHPRGDTDEEGFRMSGSEWTGNQSGMGSRRQGRETDPSRPDDSQHQREAAVEQADRAQFADEGYHHRPRMGERGEVEPPNRTGYDEDELDNQSPYGKHAVPAPEQPQAMNSQARVGEGLKPAVELNLEAADVPVKPHQHAGGTRGA